MFIACTGSATLHNFLVPQAFPSSAVFIKHQPVLVLQHFIFFGCSSLSHFCNATKHQPVPALQHLICSRPVPVFQHLLIISMSHFCSIDAHQAYTSFACLQNIGQRQLALLLQANVQIL